LQVVVFRAVPTLETASIWPEAAAVLAPVLERLAVRFLPSDIQSRLADERMQLFVAECGGRVKTACVTQVLTFPRCRALDIIGIAGNGHDLWREWFVDLMNCARLMNCQFITASAGRDGWARVMKESGLQKMGIQYQMEIGHA